MASDNQAESCLAAVAVAGCQRDQRSAQKRREIRNIQEALTRERNHRQSVYFFSKKQRRSADLSLQSVRLSV